MVEKDNDVGVAMALVIGAGAATGLGAAVVFFPSLVRFANNKTLAAALGLSAGVMTYVSFAEIFIKSQDSFQDADFSEDQSKLYATLCFFAGVVTMVVRFCGFGTNRVENSVCCQPLPYNMRPYSPSDFAFRVVSVSFLRLF